MRLASHLHYAGDLTDLMRRIPHRQFEMWMEWLDQQWNKPDRTDHYLMQLATIVNGMFNEARDMKIKFTFEAPKSPNDWKRPTPEQIAASEAAWTAAIAGSTKKTGGT